jgi:murein DD-endopeptidase MepM/ murein hydrolase activator NlpD
MFLLGASPVLAQDVLLVVTPAQILQGDTILIQVPSAPNLDDVSTVTFNGAPVKDFIYNGKVSALIPIELTKKPGDYSIKVILKNGQLLEKTIPVEARTKPQETLGVPKKFGGTTPATTKKLVKSLAVENKSLKSIRTADHALWQNAFILPVTNPSITDPFGYSRHTGAYTITHMGTDFKASKGTPVMAMNRGVVRIVHKYRTYGNTIVIDHGLGLSTLYLHLSKMNVHVGDIVTKKQMIGYSGDTGFVSGPHLHVSVHLAGVSVDPMQFLALFQ